MLVDFSRRNFGLDILRAIAITLVLVIHLITNFSHKDIGVFWYLAYLGVDIFFVLSGFLIGNILISSIDPSTGSFTFFMLKRFFIRRWLRTVPLYYILLFMNFIVGYSLLHNVERFDFRFLLWLQNFNKYPPHFFGEAWSLSIEEWFYFLFPLGLFVSLRLNSFKRKYPLNLLVYTVIFLVVGCGLRFCILDLSQGYNKVVVSRLDAIGYGVLFAILDNFFLKHFFKSYYKVCGITGGILTVIAILTFLSKRIVGSLYLLYYPLIGIGLSLIIIYMKQIPLSKISALNRAISTVSKISYSLYLNNLIVIYLVRSYVLIGPVSQFLLSFVLILALSAFTYNVVEMRFIGLREAYFPAIKSRPASKSQRTVIS